MNMMFILFVVLPCSIMAASLINTEQCTEGDIVPDDHNNQRYYLCEDEYWKILECPEGTTFDAVDRLCDDDASIDSEECSSEGDMEPDEDNNQLYYLCENGCWNTLECPDGTVFDDVHKMCLDAESIISEQCTEGDIVPDQLSNQVYYLCEDEYWKMLECPEGTTFDAVDKTCEDIYELECNAEPPRYCPAGTYLPHYCDCTMYYACREDAAEEMSCLPGTAFNARTSRCVDIDEVQSCPQTVPDPVFYF